MSVSTSCADLMEVGRPLEDSEPENSMITESSSSAGVRCGELAGLKPNIKVM